MTSRVPVTAMPSLDPSLGRIEVDVPYGLTVAEIVAQVLPGARSITLDRARVWLVTNAGETLLSARAAWHRIRPRPGVRVMIKLVAGNDGLRNALLVAVSIGAAALGQYWAAPAIGGLFGGSAVAGAVGGALFAAGATLLGGYVVNLLIPPAGAAGGRSSEQAGKPLYAISGWQNTANRDGSVPSVLGRMRVAPVFAASTYTEIVGDDQYIRALFTFGYGPVELSNLKLGDTPLAAFDEVTTQIRNGYPGDAGTSLFSNQVLEQSLGVEMRRDRQRNSAGEVSGTGPAVPVSRFTAADATQACVIFNFPSGLIAFETEGDDAGTPKTRTVEIRVRQRPATGGAWQTVKSLRFSNKKREGFFRSHRWTLPSRGQWEIECTRITHESTDVNVADRSVWHVLQSFRPEAPINFGDPLCKVAMRIKATYQLNSTLDTFNAIAERLIPDWDHASQTWVVRKTRNPASHYRHILQGPENAFPEPDSALDLAWFQDLHDFCRVKGLKYDKNWDASQSVWDAATEVCAAGRASPRYDGTTWSGVIDRPGNLVVAHVGENNAWDFNWSRSYFEPPHAFRVPFLDETSDHQQRERVVRWPGYTGDITLTEQIDMPGKTDPAEIWVEARRRQYEIIHRPDQFSLVQDGMVRTATRGDLVKGSFPAIARHMSAHRIKAVRDNAITLNGLVEMVAGQQYAISFMRQVGEGNDADFVGVVRSVTTFAGETDTLVLNGTGDAPQNGAMIHFGIAGSTSFDLVVAGVESGESATTVMTLLEKAPIIDTLTDAEVPPAWNGRAGSDAGADVAVPAVPRVVSIDPNFDSDGDPDGVIVLLAPGEGSAAVVASFTLRHRLSRTATWTEATADAATGAVVASGYAPAAGIEMQRLATSIEGYPSEWSDTFTASGAAAPAEPTPQPITSGSVTGGTGEATFNVTTANDVWIDTVGLYYGPNSDGSLVNEIAVFAADPLSNYTRTETVPAGTWYFFAVTFNSEGTPSVGFSLGQETIA